VRPFDLYDGTDEQGTLTGTRRFWQRDTRSAWVRPRLAPGHEPG
jgi:hypothetical protein